MSIEFNGYNIEEYQENISKANNSNPLDFMMIKMIIIKIVIYLII
jgi:hypothetical protein